MMVIVTVNTTKGPVDVHVPESTYDMGPEDYIKAKMWDMGMDPCAYCGTYSDHLTNDRCAGCPEED